MKQLFWQSIMYSFLGFLLEVLFARITKGDKQDRKCMLLLPLCPVYGIGAVVITHLPAFVRRRLWLLFICGALAATLVEYVVDYLYEKVLHVRFWDYSALPININGRVCLPFSVAWGLLSLGLVYGVHPFISFVSSQVPPGWTMPAVLVVLLDTVLTVLALRMSGKTDVLRWYDRLRRHTPDAKEDTAQ